VTFWSSSLTRSRLRTTLHVENIMPKETFKNLADAKRERFLDAAFREFAGRDFKSASITRIVDALGIAKGSVYQYFDDKLEVYSYLLGLAFARKFAWLGERSVSSSEGDFFRRLRTIILASSEFDLRNPLCSLLILNALRESPASEAGSVVAALRRRNLDSLIDLVRDGLSSGALRQGTDELLAAMVVDAASLSIAGFMEAKFGFSLVDTLEHPDAPRPFSNDDFERAVDGLIDILRKGIEA
jgi:AcrR family transcriptional regulator